MKNPAHDYAQQLGLPIDELLIFQIVTTTVLAAAARGEIDLNELARDELASRGMNVGGHWVGFARAVAVGMELCK